MQYHVPHIINGKKITTSGRKLEIFNPALGETCGYVNVADKKMVDEAVNAAKAAFKTWSLTTATHRAKLLFRFKTLLDQNI